MGSFYFFGNYAGRPPWSSWCLTPRTGLHIEYAVFVPFFLVFLKSLPNIFKEKWIFTKEIFQGYYYFIVLLLLCSLPSFILFHNLNYFKPHLFFYAFLKFLLIYPACKMSILFIRKEPEKIEKYTFAFVWILGLSVFLSVFSFKVFNFHLFNVIGDTYQYRFPGLIIEPAHLSYVYLFLFFLVSKLPLKTSPKIPLSFFALSICSVFLSKSMSFLVLIQSLIFLFFLKKVKILLNKKELILCTLIFIAAVSISWIPSKQSNLPDSEETIFYYEMSRLQNSFKGADGSIKSRIQGSFETAFLLSPIQKISGLGLNQVSFFVEENYKLYQHRKANDYETHLNFLYLYLSLGILPFIILLLCFDFKDTRNWLILPLSVFGGAFITFSFLLSLMLTLSWEKFIFRSASKKLENRF